MDAQKLLDILQELADEEISTFKWQLRQPKNFVGCGLKPLRVFALENARNRESLVNLIIGKYTNDAQEIVMKALKKIDKDDLADMLADIPEAAGVERSQSTQATASGVDTPQSTQATASGVERSQSTQATASGVERPQSTQATASGVDGPQSTQATASGVEGPQSTQATGMDAPGKTADVQYELNSQPTGLCVIMHNENFKNPRANRNGTDKDAGDLARTFSWLGFRVLMCKDQTKGQMEESLKRFSSTDLTGLQGSSVKEWSGWAFTDLNVNNVPQHGDAFVCCIMSHGSEGCVKGTDMGPVYIKDITTAFNGQNCSVLLNMPKVFFIQACQGSGIQSGIAADNIPELQEDAPPVVNLLLTPVDADVLVSMSTVENCVSFRDPNDGTWFMQSVCKQLKEGCYSGDDLCTILLRVNNEVSQKVGKLGHLNAIQMPEFKKVTLRKRLVFSPMFK